MEILSNATSEQLQVILDHCLNIYDEPIAEYSELYCSLFEHVINSIERDKEGRLIEPALWDSDVEHMLAKNFNLAHKILQSTLHKLHNNHDAL